MEAVSSAQVWWFRRAEIFWGEALGGLATEEADPPTPHHPFPHPPTDRRMRRRPHACSRRWGQQPRPRQQPWWEGQGSRGSQAEGRGGQGGMLSLGAATQAKAAALVGGAALRKGSLEW